jgi:hypothetical protein
MGQFSRKLTPEYFLRLTAPKRFNHYQDSTASRYYRQALSFFCESVGRQANSYSSLLSRHSSRLELMVFPHHQAITTQEFLAIL